MVRQEIAKLLIMSKSAEWTARRARAAQEQGKPQGPEGSLGKLVASNVARHHVRSEIRRKRVAEAVAAESRTDVLDGAAQVLSRERAARVRDAIADLPPKLREVFVLVYLEGIPGRDVAVLLGTREGTIWKRLHQARARLRESLEGVLR